MKLTLVGTGIALPHVDQSALRYNLANAYLEAQIRSQPDLGEVEVRRIDLSLSLNTPHFDEASVKRVLSTKPEVLGLSCYSWDLDAQLALAATVRKEMPLTKILLGGPSAGFRAEDLLRENPAIDAIVLGEGEETLVELLRSDVSQWNRVLGIALRDSRGGCQVTELRAPVDLENLSSPLLSGILVPPKQNLMFEFSRGCLYRCTYCAWKSSKGGLRYVSESRIRKEIQWAHDQRYEHAFIIDSALNNHTDRLKIVADAVTQADPNSDLAFSYFINYAFITPEQIEHLKRIRPHEITVGFESINPNALRAAGRRAFDREVFARSLDLLSNVAPVTLSFMLGMPGDDLPGFKATLDYIAEQAERPGPKRVRMARVHWMLIAPGSSLFQHAGLYGLQIAKTGIPYVTASKTFSTDQMIEALNYVLSHKRRDLFVWEDAEPLRLLGREIPDMFSAGGDHVGGRSGRSLPESELLAAIKPLQPGRALPGDWVVGPVSQEHGWPVVLLEHKSGRQIRIQFRSVNAEPNPFARTAQFDLIWLASDEKGRASQAEEARLVSAIVDLVRKNEVSEAVGKVSSLDS